MLGQNGVNKYSKIFTRVHIGLNESANGNGFFSIGEEKEGKKYFGE